MLIYNELLYESLLIKYYKDFHTFSLQFDKSFSNSQYIWLTESSADVDLCLKNNNSLDWTLGALL